MNTQNTRRPSHMAPGPGGPGGPSRSAPARLAANIDPLRVLRRHIVLIAASVVVGAGLGLVAHVLCSKYYPLYSGWVTFEIQPGVRESREVGATEIANDQLAFRMANTESVLMLQRDILRDALIGSHHQDILKTRWHRSFLTPEGRLNVEEAVDDLEKTLSASVVRTTNFFRLGWRAHHASDVPIVLNSIAAAYMARRRSIDDSVWNDNVERLNQTLNETTVKLDIVDDEIRKFINDNQITTLDGPRYGTPAIAAEHLTGQIMAVNAGLSQTRSALAQTALKLGGTLEPSAEDYYEAERDPIVLQQLQVINALNTDIRMLREQGVGERHLSSRELQSRLRAAEAQFRAKRDEVIKRNLESRMKVLNDERERYESLLEMVQKEAEAKDEELIALAAAMAQYNVLEARRERLETQRDNDLALLHEIGLIRLRSDASRVRVAQHALIPREPSFPRIQIMVPLGALLTLAFTIGIIFLRELTDQRIKSASDLAVLPSAKVLGVIPDLQEDPTGSTTAESVVRKHPRSVLAESYRQACTMVLRGVERNGHQTIVLLGGMPGAGTTTAVTNLAGALASSGMSVLVVDANFRRPRLAKAMEVDSEGPGLGDVLVGAATIGDVIQEAEPGISVVSAGTPANRVFERLNNGRFESMVAEARQRFDIVLFDAPPAIVAGDAMVLANRVDAAILVVRANQEQRGLVARLLHQLADAKCDPLGILLNRPRGTAGGYFKKNFETMAEYSAK